MVVMKKIFTVFSTLLSVIGLISVILIPSLPLLFEVIGVINNEFTIFRMLAIAMSIGWIGLSIYFRVNLITINGYKELITLLDQCCSSEIKALNSKAVAAALSPVYESENKLLKDRSFLDGKIKFFYMDGKKSFGGFVTCPIVNDGAYIFLPSKPDNFTSTMKFALLHEIGHAKLLSGAALSSWQSVLLVSMSSLIYLGIRSYQEIDSILFFGMCVISFFCLALISFKAKMKFENFLKSEVAADIYALKNSAFDWASEFSFASYCRLMEADRNFQSHTDAINRRKIAFHENLRRYKEGDRLTTAAAIESYRSRAYIFSFNIICCAVTFFYLASGANSYAPDWLTLFILFDLILVFFFICLYFRRKRDKLKSSTSTKLP